MEYIIAVLVLAVLVFIGYKAITGFGDVEESQPVEDGQPNDPVRTPEQPPREDEEEDGQPPGDDERPGVPPMPIEELDLKKRIKTILLKRDIKTVDELVDRDLTQIPGIGQARADEIHEALQVMKSRSN